MHVRATSLQAQAVGIRACADYARKTHSIHEYYGQFWILNFMVMLQCHSPSLFLTKTCVTPLSSLPSTLFHNSPPACHGEAPVLIRILAAKRT